MTMLLSSIQPINVEPYFDLELFMITSQETRIHGETMSRITEKWDAWLPYAHAYKILLQDVAYLLVYLEDYIEEEIDAMWADSPSEAFMFNALAQVMCMGMVHSVLPEVENAGCAPSPEITEALRLLLLDVGVSYSLSGKAGVSSRRYSVLTYFTFKGSCGVCVLQEDCPKNIHCRKSPHIIELFASEE